MQCLSSTSLIRNLRCIHCNNKSNNIRQSTRPGPSIPNLHNFISVRTNNVPLNVPFRDGHLANVAVVFVSQHCVYRKGCIPRVYIMFGNFGAHKEVAQFGL